MRQGSLKDRLSDLLTLLRTSLLEKVAIPLARPIAQFDPQALCYRVTDQNFFGALSLNNCGEVARLVALLKSSESRLQARELVNKRTIYYELIRFYKGHYEKLDDDLRVLCHSLQCRRAELLIQASSRCLVQGQLTALQNHSLVSYGEVCFPQAYQYTSGDLVALQARALLIVEKEAMVQVLLNDPLWTPHNIAVLTAKGCPDYSARALVTQLADRLPVYYIGDADPYGADILLQYSLGNPNSAVQGFGNPHIRWLLTDLYIEHFPGRFLGLQHHLMHLSKEDHAKLQRLCALPIWELLPADERREKLLGWRQRIVRMKERGMKFQLEGIWKTSQLSLSALIVELITNNYFL